MTLRSIQISTSASKAQSKEQKTYNSLLKKMEVLKRERAALIANLNYKKTYAEVHLRKVMIEQTELWVQILEIHFEDLSRLRAKVKKQLLSIYIINKANELSTIPGLVNQQQAGRLKEMIDYCSQLVHPEEEYDDGLYDDDDEPADIDPELIAKLEYLKHQCSIKGIHIHPLMFIKCNSTEEVIAEIEKLLGEGPEKRNTKSGKSTNSKTFERKQQKEKDKEDLKKKNLKSIYVQLAKVLHPDIEQEESEKMKKEELMKELTLAYNKKDLATLLRLEQEHLEDNASRIEQLPSEQLKLYIELFREQVATLEQDLAAVYLKPDFHFIRYFVEWPKDLKFWRPETSLKKELGRNNFLTQHLRNISLSKAIRKAVTDEIIEQVKFDLEEEW